MIIIDSLSCDVHPVMLVMHVKCQHSVQHTDISLESVIDKSSDLDIAKFGVKNEISNSKFPTLQVIVNKICYLKCQMMI